MNNRPATLLMRAVLAMICLASSGCSSPPKENFYTLIPATATTTATTLTSAVPAESAAYTVAVGPVRVPEIVDRPQLVVRTGPTHVDLLDQHRWAQPLRAEIAQAIAAQLRATLPTARIALDRDTAGQNPDYRVAVDISRFDAVPGEAVTVHALWTISPSANKSVSMDKPLSGQTAAQEAVRGSGADALANAFARALTTVSRDIAATLSGLRK